MYTAEEKYETRCPYCLKELIVYGSYFRQSCDCTIDFIHIIKYGKKDIQHQLYKIQEEKKELGKNYEHVKKQRNELHEKYEKTRDILEALRVDNNELREIRTKNDELQKEIASLTRLLKESHEEVIELHGILSKKDLDQKRLNDLCKERNLQQGQIIQYEKRCEHMQKELCGLRTEIRVQKDTIEALSKEKKDMKEIFNEVQRDRDHLHARVKELLDENSEFHHIHEQCGSFKSFYMKKCELEEELKIVQEQCQNLQKALYEQQQVDHLLCHTNDCLKEKLKEAEKYLEQSHMENDRLQDLLKQRNDHNLSVGTELSSAKKQVKELSERVSSAMQDQLRRMKKEKEMEEQYEQLKRECQVHRNNYNRDIENKVAALRLKAQQIDDLQEEVRCLKQKNKTLEKRVEKKEDVCMNGYAIASSLSVDDAKEMVDMLNIFYYDLSDRCSGYLYDERIPLLRKHVTTIIDDLVKNGYHPVLRCDKGKMGMVDYGKWSLD